MIDVIDQFSRAMSAAGLVPVKHSIVADGRLHRFRVDGDKAGRENGWYVLFLDGIAAGSFGSWKTGESHSWCSKAANELTQDEREANRQRMEAARRAREDELKRLRAAAREKAERLWSRAREQVDANHPYIKSKGVRPVGARQLGKMLVVPIWDISGPLMSLQFILPDGTKRYLSNGQKEGGLVVLAGRGGRGWRGDVMICEGWATGCSLVEATGNVCVVCFDSGNILPVAKAIKAGNPNTENFIVCADDDWKTVTPVVNPGMIKAAEAAEAICARVAVPQFDDERPEWATDFNDMHRLYGLEAVRDCVAADHSKVVDLAKRRAEKAKADRDKETADDGNKKTKEKKAEKEINWQKLKAIVDRYVLIYGTDTCYDAQERLIMKVNALRLAITSEYVNLWLASSERRTIRQDELVFDPTNSAPESSLNLYDGFAMKPKAGNFAPILELLNHLCADSAESDAGVYDVMDWVLKWLALPLQRPGAKMRTALVFHGPQGTGKNLFFEVIAAIYGRYALVVGQAELEEKYNDWMSQKLFLIGDEVIAKQELYDQKNKLKTFITGTVVHIHGKFLPLRSERNHINVVFLSNEEQPLALEPSDRRYFVIYTPPQRVDGLYQEVAQCIKNGGIEAFYHHLMHLQLGDFNEFSKPIITTAKKDLINLGLKPSQRFAYEWLSEHIPLPVAGCTSEQLYNAFRFWADKNGEKWPPNKANFSSQVLKATGILKPDKDGNPAIEYRKVRLPYSRNGKTTVMMWVPRGCGPADDVSIGHWAVNAEGAFSQALDDFRSKENSYV